MKFYTLINYLRKLHFSVTLRRIQAHTKRHTSTARKLCYTDAQIKTESWKLCIFTFYSFWAIYPEMYHLSLKNSLLFYTFNSFNQLQKKLAYSLNEFDETQKRSCFLGILPKASGPLPEDLILPRFSLRPTVTMISKRLIKLSITVYYRIWQER